MTRTKEITIIHYRRRRVMAECCPVCGSDSGMLTVAEATELTGLSRSMLYSWISRNQAHAARWSGAIASVILRR